LLMTEVKVRWRCVSGMGLFCGGVVVVICGLDQSKERIVAMLDGQFNEKE